MRVLSQDGMADLPYESIGICINYHNKTDIIAYPAATFSPGDEYWTLAHYSTEAKTMKAMEILHEAYRLCNLYKNLIVDQKVVLIENTPEKEQERLYWMFRFPDDDETEA